ncbi:IMP cyclohydrolase [Streptomyces sp. NPDC058955]|uniref:IMP cyclohydrolase n=1 Tax=unclassified Streptomyces TaxID=2593676 RepID=UPI00365433B7
MTDLKTLLSSNPYPGRGVLCARTLSGDVLGGYFLTGRSAASKDRALRLVGDELLVGPTEETEHDPLRHYAAALATPEWLVFGNGEQVSEVTGRLLKGASAADSLGELEYEPDPPIRTSRITALLSRDGGRTAVLGAARPSTGTRLTTNVMTLTVRDLEPGEALLMTTYRSDGQTVAVASPFDETTTGSHDAEGLLDEIWSALNPAYRVAAVVLDPSRGPASAVQRSI